MCFPYTMVTVEAKACPLLPLVEIAINSLFFAGCRPQGGGSSGLLDLMLGVQLSGCSFFSSGVVFIQDFIGWLVSASAVPLHVPQGLGWYSSFVVGLSHGGERAVLGFALSHGDGIPLHLQGSALPCREGTHWVSSLIWVGRHCSASCVGGVLLLLHKSGLLHGWGAPSCLLSNGRGVQLRYSVTLCMCGGVPLWSARSHGKVTTPNLILILRSRLLIYNLNTLYFTFCSYFCKF